MRTRDLVAYLPLQTGKMLSQNNNGIITRKADEENTIVRSALPYVIEY